MKRPLVVKASAASVIFFLSDSATQQITDPEKSLDIARAGSGAVFGVVATAWLHYWWGFLEVFVGKRLPVAQYRLSNTLCKVFLDQAIGAPIYIYTYFVITNFIQDFNALPNKSQERASELFTKTCDKAAGMLPPTMLRHWTLWPAVHTFNFYYMSLHHRGKTRLVHCGCIVFCIGFLLQDVLTRHSFSVSQSWYRTSSWWDGVDVSRSLLR
jgi:hypothetical protein